MKITQLITKGRMLYLKPNSPNCSLKKCMEISLDNFYVDLEALRVNELNEGGDIFWRDFSHHL